MDRIDKIDDSKLSDDQLNKYGPEKMRRDFIRAQQIIYAVVKDDYIENLLINNRVKEKNARNELARELERYIQSLKELNEVIYPVKCSTYKNEVKNLPELQIALLNLMKSLKAEINFLYKQRNFIQKRIDENVQKQNNILNDLKTFSRNAFNEDANYDLFNQSSAKEHLSKDDFREIGGRLSETLPHHMINREIKDVIHEQLPGLVSESILSQIGHEELTDLIAGHYDSQEGFSDAVKAKKEEYNVLSVRIEKDKTHVVDIDETLGLFEHRLGDLEEECVLLGENGYIDASFLKKTFEDITSLISSERPIAQNMVGVENIFLDGTLNSQLSHYDDPFADETPALKQNNENDDTRPRMGR